MIHQNHWLESLDTISLHQLIKIIKFPQVFRPTNEHVDKTFDINRIDIPMSYPSLLRAMHLCQLCKISIPNFYMIPDCYLFLGTL